MKPLSLEMGIHMCSSHLLKFFDYHIRDEEGGEMTLNLPDRFEVRREVKKRYQARHDVNENERMNENAKMRETSLKKFSSLSLWAMETNFSKFRERMLLINLSWAFDIISQISVEDLRASGVASWYNSQPYQPRWISPSETNTKKDEERT